MSAFICSDKHISTIALNAIDFDRYKEFKNPVTGKPFTVQELADELKRLNINSVNYRYDESVPVSSCDLQEAVLLGHRIDPGDEHRRDNGHIGCFVAAACAAGVAPWNPSFPRSCWMSPAKKLTPLWTVDMA
jgi:hypothetical protein